MTSSQSASTVPRDVLLAFGLQEAAVTPIEQGLVNRHWRLELGHTWYVLRRYHSSRTREAIAWEQWLVDFAAKLGWPVAKPVPTGDGETLAECGGWYWAAAPYLEGEPGAGTTPGAYRRVGETLAELHDNLSALGGAQRPGFAPTWELDVWAGRQGFDTMLRELAAMRPGLAGLVRALHARTMNELRDGGVDQLPLLPIHGDFHRFNLLWKGGRITGIVDFDSCRRDALIADIAPVLVPFMPLEPEVAAALLEGYESVRPLSARERDLLLPMVRASLLRWVASLLAEWDRTGELAPGIERTITERVPAFEAAEPAYRELFAR